MSNIILRVQEGHEALAAKWDRDYSTGTGSEWRDVIHQALHRRRELLHVGPPHEFYASVKLVPPRRITGPSRRVPRIPARGDERMRRFSAQLKRTFCATHSICCA